jgi:hypothetical protein
MTNFRVLLPVICIVLFTYLFAADSESDRITATFNNPNKEGRIEVSLINGGISVEGYEGQEVIVEAVPRSKKIIGDLFGEKLLTDEEVLPELLLEDFTGKRKKNTEGMKKLTVRSTGLSLEEEDNVIQIGVDSWRVTVDLNLRVPRNTSLHLNCVNAGDIEVKNVAGEIDVNNTNGAVTLTDVSGSVVAHSLNRDVLVTFNKVAPLKAMSFSTMNGDIDVTFPTNLKANVEMKTNNGEIYTDYDIKLQEKPRRIVEKNSGGKGGKYQIKIEKTLYGTINGGGPEIQFTSFNGDILIRKAK